MSKWHKEDTIPIKAGGCSQLTILWPNTSEQRYITYKHRFERQLRYRAVLKHQYFQLLIDLSPIIVIMLNRHSKV